MPQPEDIELNIDYIDGFHVTSNDDVCFDFFNIWSRVWQARKCGRWVEIGMKGRKYIVFWDGIGLKLIIVSKTFIYLLYISLIV